MIVHTASWPNFALSEDSVANEFNFFREDRLGFNPAPKRARPRDEEREGRVGGAGQFEASGATDLLCHFRGEGSVYQSENPASKNHFESEHEVLLRV